MAFMQLVVPVASLLETLQNILLRQMEYQADAYAYHQGFPLFLSYSESFRIMLLFRCDLGTPLVILETENLMDFDPDPLFVIFVLDTHIYIFYIGMYGIIIIIQPSNKGSKQ